MRPVFIVLLLFISLASSAQTRQQQKVDSVFALVKTYFNAKNADALYNLAGDAFQKEISINNFGDIAAKQLFPLGQIKDAALTSFVNNSLATYKVSFTNATMNVFISLMIKASSKTFCLSLTPSQHPIKLPWYLPTTP
jgi:hypothetical protein